MKTTIWASCPKCQTELKIDTDETELVQIECPDCHKVFAAKVPPRSAAPIHEVFSQMPVLPPFQTAQVHYKPRHKSDDSMNPAALTALIVVCASAILIPLGFGGYYFYGKLSEASTLTMSNSSDSAPASTSNTQPSFSTAPSNSSMDTASSFNDFSVQTPAGRNTPSSSNSASNILNTTDQPQPDTTARTDSVTFGVPELNPPMLIQPESSTPQTTPPQNSTPMTTGPTPTGTVTPNPGNPGTVNPSPVTPGTPIPGNGTSSQVQVSVAGAGTSQSGLPVPLQRFVGPSGVLIFILHSKGHSVTNSVQELQRNLSIPEMHAEGGSDHTSVGFRYSGTIDSVVKGIRFGKVSYVDEESRSIHVQVN